MSKDVPYYAIWIRKTRKHPQARSCDALPRWLCRVLEGSTSSLALLGISLPEENHLAWGYSSYPMTNPYGGIKVLGPQPKIILQDQPSLKALPWVGWALHGKAMTAKVSLCWPCTILTFYRYCLPLPPDPNTLFNFLPANPPLSLVSMEPKLEKSTCPEMRSIRYITVQPLDGILCCY